MPRRILCTTGTSIAVSLGQNTALFASTPWNELPNAELSAMRQRIATLDPSSSEVWRKLSAETHILQRLACGPEDEVWLLASDTGGGRACAEVLSIAITRAFGCKAPVHRIKGLQVFDARLFRETGLQSLTQTIVTAANGTAETLLCPIGGYKIVVPFTAIAGMLLGLKSYYIFEGAETLIELPPLPVSFDQSLYEKIRPVVALLKHEGAVNESQLWAALPDVAFEERPLVSSFFESDGGFFTLSPLASVLVGIEENATYDVVLSAEAREQFNASGANHQVALTRYLWRIQSPLWRSQTIHKFNGSDLTVWKIPHPQVYRIAGFIRGTTVHICLIFTDHENYDRNLSNRTLSEFRSVAFTPWVPSEGETEAESNYQSLITRMEHHRAVQSRLVEELEAQVKLLESRLERVTRESRRNHPAIRPVSVDTIRSGDLQVSAPSACPPEIVGTIHSVVPGRQTGSGRHAFIIPFKGKFYWAYLPKHALPPDGNQTPYQYRVVNIHPNEGLTLVCESPAVT